MPADVAQLVERNLAKVEVASSSLVVRSEKRPRSSRPGSLSFPGGKNRRARGRRPRNVRGRAAGLSAGKARPRSPWTGQRGGAGAAADCGGGHTVGARVPGRPTPGGRGAGNGSREPGPWAGAKGTAPAGSWVDGGGGRARGAGAVVRRAAPGSTGGGRAGAHGRASAAGKLAIVGLAPRSGDRNGRRSTERADVAQLVERNLAKVEVASSSLVVRSGRRPRSSRPGPSSSSGAGVRPRDDR